jgi:ubiquinone biosynthesis protein COQ9
VAGLSPDQQALAAPDGADSLIEAFLMRGDHAMLAALASRQDEPMRTRDRVALAVMAWMEPLRPHKAALKRAVGRGALPGQMPRALGRTWQLADAIWTGVGDTATDYNRYTKRGFLALVLPQVMLVWLQTDDDVAVRAFLDRRIGEVMQAGRTVGGAFSSLLSGLNPRRPA